VPALEPAPRPRLPRLAPPDYDSTPLAGSATDTARAAPAAPQVHWRFDEVTGPGHLDR